MALYEGAYKKVKARFIAPELCTLRSKIFDNQQWLFEEKFDGIRCIAVKKEGKISLFSRSKKPLLFPVIAQALERAETKDFVADGEIIAFEGKISSFAKLQKRQSETIRAYLYLFDLLLWDECDLRKSPLIERKQMLKTKILFGGPIQYTPHVKGKGKNFFRKAKKTGLEGVIGKAANSPYNSKRSTQWLKFKCTRRQELVIGGYTDLSHARRAGFGALLVGYYEKGSFRYAGKVGTGYSQKMLSTLKSRLLKLERKSSPFSGELKEKGVHFVRPSLVCEVGFTEWTKEGKLRPPTFLGLRSDKPAKQVRREE